MAVPAQMAWLATAFTVTSGFTVIVNVVALPLQTALAGVTVMVAVTGADPALAAVKEGTLPVPDAARPMEGLSFVQL